MFYVLFLSLAFCESGRLQNSPFLHSVILDSTPYFPPRWERNLYRWKGRENPLILRSVGQKSRSALLKRYFEGWNLVFMLYNVTWISQGQLKQNLYRWKTIKKGKNPIAYEFIRSKIKVTVTKIDFCLISFPCQNGFWRIIIGFYAQSEWNLHRRE